MPATLSPTPLATIDNAATGKPARQSTRAVASGVPKGVAPKPESAKPSFKARMLVAREDAILQAVNKRLAEQGFDLMTVDEIAADVGIAKASLYKHFPSKEALAAATMALAMQRACAFVQAVPPHQTDLYKLKAVVRWVMAMALAGDMPSLPSQNSRLRQVLMNHPGYMDGLMLVSDTLGGWIEGAQGAGQLSKAFPATAVLYTIYSRACDPVLEFLKMGGQHTDEQIIEMVTATCFEGLAAR